MDEKEPPKTGPVKDGSGNKKSEREARSARALRENLKRRKKQTQGWDKADTVKKDG